MADKNRTAAQALEFVELLDLMNRPDRWDSHQGPASILPLINMRTVPHKVGVLICRDDKVNPVVCIPDKMATPLNALGHEYINEDITYKSLGDIIRAGWMIYTAPPNPFVSQPVYYQTSGTTSTTFWNNDGWS